MAWFACLQPQARNTCPSQSTGGAIFLIQFGKNPSPVCPAVKEAGAAELATTGALSMRFSGLCARALRGETRPPDFGGWSDTRRRFTRWRDNGVWERPPEIPIADDRRRSLRGSSTCGGRERRQPGHGPRKRGLNTKSHLTADAHGMPVRAFVTQGTTADCARAIALTDKGHDTDQIFAQAERWGMEAVIFPRKNR